MAAADFWFDKLSRYPVLSEYESLLLFRDIQDGKDENGNLSPRAARALKKVVSHNMRLIVKIWTTQYAHIVTSQNQQLPDLFQEGAYGLQKAALNFDSTLGYKFSTYANFWIRRYINIWLGNRNRVIKAPLAAIEVSIEYEKIRYEASFEETIKRLATRFKIKTDLVKVYLDCVQMTGTVHEYSNYRAHVEYRNQLEDHNGPIGKFDLIASRAQLDPEEREILLAYQQGFTLTDLPRLFPNDPHIVKRYQAVRRRFKKAANELLTTGSLSVA